MPSARKLPSGRWICEGFFVDPSGRRIRKSFTADSKKAAEEKALSFSVTASTPSKESFSYAMDAFLASRRPVLSPSTIRSYAGIVRALREGFPSFCSLSLSEIRSEDLQRLINDLSRSHSPKTVKNLSRSRSPKTVKNLSRSRSPKTVKNLSRSRSPKTVKNYSGFISAVFASAGLHAPSVTLPRQKKPDYRIPSSETVKKVLDAASGTPLEIPILLAAVCTMRAGEICALTLDDIDGTRIHVRRSKVRGEDNLWHEKAPKTYSSDRIIEAPAWIIEKITEQGFVTHYNSSSLSIAFGKLLTRTSIPHFRFHDLRHYSASYMHASGIPTAYIMQRGGWKTETVLNSVYRHALSDEEKKNSDRINSGFSSLFQD